MFFSFIPNKLRGLTQFLMAGKHIKHEAGSSQPPKNESRSSVKSQMPAGRATTKEPSTRKSVVNKQIGKSLAALSSQKNVTKTARPKFLWEGDISERPRVQVVKIFEDAAEHGNTFIQEVTQELKDHQQLIPSVKHRINRHIQVYKERRECQMHIGFLGGSGTGKSSVINALLGEENLLPVSDETASTAVIVEISYNNRDDPECLYSASIEGFYEDMAKWNSGIEEEEGGPDIEILQRMQDTASKYKCVFPEFKELDDWLKTSVDKLLARTSVQLLMDKKRIIEKHDLKEFATAIKPFIDTSKQKDSGVSQSLWPLVKVVRIFTKAPILKAGIVFVDLPGVHDTSAARNAIARNHLKNLNISCVVSPSVRAGSDKGAHEMLNSIQKRNIQFDGLFTAESLFFVVSKIDDSLCRLKSECIKNRDEIQIAAIIEEFEVGRKEIGEKDSSKTLQIFCISAQAFMNVCTGQQSKALESGFFTRDDTGIPKFRDALIATTWETRLRNARTFNEEVASAAALLDIWSSDTIIDFKMRAGERAIVDSKLDEMYGALEQKLVLRDWVQKPIAWNTHRAVNKRSGVWISAKAGKDFDWNEQLNDAFLKHMMTLWDQTLHKKLPALKEPYHERVDILIAEFADLSLSAADNISASFRDSFENIKDSVIAHRRRLKQGASDVLADFNASGKDIWRLIKTECEETCTGMYERNKEAHKVHLKGDGGLAMYNSASTKMQEAFQEACKSLPGKFQGVFTDSLDIIKQEFIDVLRQHTTSGTRQNTRRVPSKLKINLRHALEPHFEQLYKAWQAEPEVESQNQKGPISDEPSDSELSDDLDELLRGGS
ncbi:hypothetical protein DID88_001481 [Monilinia fructigena]|uniref:Dynamin N-terminal domain-containing protein n=1 Tax=Monilinia fructigena TaxID=38457 RepID=A0A395IY07_9HELO|nr:hypothetical protein DID88_001481 [Monilinia fructigena]